MFVIRSYRKGDSDAVKKLFREISRTHEVLYRPRRKPGRDPDRWYRSHLRKHGRHSLRVIEDRGKVVGLVGLVVHGGSCEIEPFVIASRYRRQGVGGTLMRAVVEEARARGWRTLSAGVAARNDQALRAFHALGFRTLVNIELVRNVLPPALFSPRGGPTLAGRRFGR